mmetsp:Transcript_3748/g.13874  ORF Transcript_3748/g.13874 Transcript_3748/m.13874 type:complete len:140 (+) Transcript_3748:3408-3827(+)
METTESSDSSPEDASSLESDPRRTRLDDIMKRPAGRRWFLFPRFATRRHTPDRRRTSILAHGSEYGDFFVAPALVRTQIPLEPCGGVSRRSAVVSGAQATSDEATSERESVRTDVVNPAGRHTASSGGPAADAPRGQII